MDVNEYLRRIEEWDGEAYREDIARHFAEEAQMFERFFASRNSHRGDKPKKPQPHVQPGKRPSPDYGYQAAILAATTGYSCDPGGC